MYTRSTQFTNVGKMVAHYPTVGATMHEISQEEIALCETEEEIVNSPSFACCHLYRKCSDAKHCVISDEARSSMCAYRENLEKGIIFYGKNANGFDAERYQKILRIVESMSPERKEKLDRLMMEYCGQRRGCSSLVVRKATAEAVDELGLFKFQPLGASLATKCLFSVLSKKIKAESPESYKEFDSFYKAFTAKQPSSEKKATGQKVRAFREWLAGPAASIRDRLAEPYRILWPVEDTRLYVEELWFDLYGAAWDRKLMAESPLKEDGLSA